MDDRSFTRLALAARAPLCRLATRRLRAQVPPRRGPRPTGGTASRSRAIFYHAQTLSWASHCRSLRGQTKPRGTRLPWAESGACWTRSSDASACLVIRGHRARRAHHRLRAGPERVPGRAAHLRGCGRGHGMAPRRLAVRRAAVRDRAASRTPPTARPSGSTPTARSTASGRRQTPPCSCAPGDWRAACGRSSAASARSSSSCGEWRARSAWRTTSLRTWTRCQDCARHRPTRGGSDAERRRNKTSGQGGASRREKPWVSTGRIPKTSIRRYFGWLLTKEFRSEKHFFTFLLWRSPNSAPSQRARRRLFCAHRPSRSTSAFGRPGASARVPAVW